MFKERRGKQCVCAHSGCLVRVTQVTLANRPVLRCALAGIQGLPEVEGKKGISGSGLLNATIARVLRSLFEAIKQ